MKTYGGNEAATPPILMEISFQLRAHYSFTLGERTPCTDCIRRWVGPIGSLDVMERRKSYPCRELNHVRPASD
jgi:hypothetical protein